MPITSTATAATVTLDNDDTSFDSIADNPIIQLATESDNIRNTALETFDTAISGTDVSIGTIVSAATRMQIDMQGAKAQDDGTKEFAKAQSDGLRDAFPR